MYPVQRSSDWCNEAILGKYKILFITLLSGYNLSASFFIQLNSITFDLYSSKYVLYIVIEKICNTEETPKIKQLPMSK